MENPDGTCTTYMYTARNVFYETAMVPGPAGPTPVFIGPDRLPFSLHFPSDCQNVKTGSAIEANSAKQAM